MDYKTLREQKPYLVSMQRKLSRHDIVYAEKQFAAGCRFEVKLKLTGNLPDVEREVDALSPEDQTGFYIEQKTSLRGLMLFDQAQQLFGRLPMVDQAKLDEFNPALWVRVNLEMTGIGDVLFFEPEDKLLSRRYPRSLSENEQKIILSCIQEAEGRRLLALSGVYE